MKFLNTRRRPAEDRRDEERRARKLRQALIAFALLIGCVVALYFVGRTIERNNEKAEPRGDISSRYTQAPAAIGDGYALRTQMTAVLVMGIGHHADASQTADVDGRADYLLLMAIDEEEKTVTPIQIDRNTVIASDTQDEPVNLAYARAGGGEDGCMAVKDAVSALLMNVDIPYYLSLDLDSVPPLTDELGGVTVQLTEDFADPAMVSGTTLMLTGAQASLYLDTDVGDGEALMLRQQCFWAGCYRQVLSRVEADGDISFTETVFNTLEPYLTTNLSRAKILNMVWNTRHYQKSDVLRLAGAYQTDGNGQTTFTPNGDALTELVR